MSTITEIDSMAKFSSELASLPHSTLLVVYFYTPWTELSTPMNVGMSTLASQCPATVPPTISFIRINAKKLVDIARQYDVSVAPHVLCLRGGHILESIRGTDPTNIRNALERHVVAGAIVVQAPTVKQPKEAKEALVTRLTELINSATVMLFMKGTPKSPLCRFSRQLVSILNEHNIKYDSFNILADEDVRQGLKEVGDWPTFPQLWVDGQLLGGLEIVREEMKADPDFMREYSV